MSFNPKFEELPETIQNLLRHGIQLTAPKKIFLFGSRARGDHHENSDFDIAFSQLGFPEKWSKFLVDFDEDPITLQKVDVLLYEETSEEYRQNIVKEGVLLYES